MSTRSKTGGFGDRRANLSISFLQKICNNFFRIGDCQEDKFLKGSHRESGGQHNDLPMYR